MGFEADEALFPYPRRTFAGFALLQELFAFPQKFQFIDVAGRGRRPPHLGAGVRAELFFVIAPFERAERRQILQLGITARTFRLGCTPVVNLFRRR